MRIACLRLPDLPLVAVLRTEPDLAGVPLVVASGAGARADVLSVSPPAAALGLRTGQTVAHARTLCGTLALRVATPARLDTARAALRDAALAFSPRTEPAAPAAGPWSGEAAVFLDASGVRARFRSEHGFASALATAADALALGEPLARAALPGLGARVGLAASRAVARLAARAASDSEPVQVLAPGREAGWLAPLALDLLAPSDALAQALTRFGLRRIGDLARLEPAALLTRLGPEALQLVALARGGADSVPLEPARVSRVEETLELEGAVERLEPLRFVLRGMLSRLAARLEARGLAAGELELALELEGGGRDARRVGLAAPSNDVRTWLRLVCLTLESDPPHQAVSGIEVATRGVPVRGDQLDLFRPVGPAPVALGRTLAELQALCGAGRVGSPALADSHRCDEFALEPFVPRRAAGTEPSDGEATPVQALRALRPPLEARVRIEAGRPAELWSAVARGRVLGCAGPWRTTGRWWSREERFAHDHYDVQTSDGTVSRLRHDRIRGSWQVDGVYD